MVPNIFLGAGNDVVSFLVALHWRWWKAEWQKDLASPFQKQSGPSAVAAVRMDGGGRKWWSLGTEERGHKFFPWRCWASIFERVGFSFATTV